MLKISFEDEAIQGCGECSPLWTLSIDPKDEYTDKLDWVCSNINSWNEFFIQMNLELSRSSLG